MRELEVSPTTRIVRALGTLLVLALAIGAMVVWAATREDKKDDAAAKTVGARTEAAAKAVGNGAASGAGEAGEAQAAPATPDAAAPTRAQMRQVRDTKVSPFAEDHALVSGLEPGLRAAVRAAATAAKEAGVGDFWLTSGWRTNEYQDELLRQGIKKHGSREAALQWVKTADTSEHVKGAAADIGPTKAAYWMTQHAERFGLCRTYANEIWHYELRAGDTCPAMKEDARG